MLQTFANLPLEIEESIEEILSQEEHALLFKSTEQLHNRYMTGQKMGKSFVTTISDVLAYLALRVPATYAQIYSTLLQVQDSIPSFKPKTVLDIGSGPGTGIWAAKEIFPSLERAVCIEKEKDFIAVGKKIAERAQLPLSILWKEVDVTKELDKISRTYDIILLSSVLSELSGYQTILNALYAKCQGIFVIVEPGTPAGYSLIQDTAQDFSQKANLIAPYLQNSFVKSNSYWIHFPQKFQRPEFQRRTRRYLRNDTLAPSDIEDAKYSYVAFGKVRNEKHWWGRVIGPVQRQKGFVEIPILTDKGIVTAKVLMRWKGKYLFAKRLRWGQIIESKTSIYPSI